MKICHTFYEEKKFGGSETYFRILRQKSQHDHAVAYVEKGLQYNETFQNFYDGFSGLIASLSGRGFDLIHNHFFIPSFFCGERGMLNLLTSHCMLSKEFLWSVNDAVNDAEASSMTRSYQQFDEAERLMYPRIRNIQVFSDFHKREIEEIGGRAEKVQIVLDANYFGKKEKTQARQDANLSDKFTILFSGRPTYYKGLHVLLDAFSRLKVRNRQLVILSDDITLEDNRVVHKPCISTARTRKEVSSHRFGRGKIVIRRTSSREELADYYSSADVFVCPSLYESVGYVNLEAMASGTPIVASNTCGIPEFVIDSATGLLFNPGSSDDLIQKIMQIREDSRLVDRIRKNQKDFISRFDVRRNINAIDQAYGDLK